MSSIWERRKICLCILGKQSLEIPVKSVVIRERKKGSVLVSRKPGTEGSKRFGELHFLEKKQKKSGNWAASYHLRKKSGMILESLCTSFSDSGYSVTPADSFFK